MEIRLDLKSEIPKAIAWTGAMADQLPWVLSKSMNAAAKDAQTAIKASMATYIKGGPVPWTYNSTYVANATRSNLTAAVGFKGGEYTSFGNGVPAGDYINTISGGGTRVAKSTEKKLRMAGILNANQFITPTGVVPLKLNKYGNIPGENYVTLLSRLGALETSGYQGNVNRKNHHSNIKRSDRDYFAATIGGHYGIMARLGKRPLGNPGGMGRPMTVGLPRGFHTVFNVVGQPHYHSTFPVIPILQDAFNAAFGPVFRANLEAEAAEQVRRGRF